jgi:hypothetical protein
MGQGEEELSSQIVACGFVIRVAIDALIASSSCFCLTRHITIGRRGKRHDGHGCKSAA